MKKFSVFIVALAAAILPCCEHTNVSGKTSDLAHVLSVVSKLRIGTSLADIERELRGWRRTDLAAYDGKRPTMFFLMSDSGSYSFTAEVSSSGELSSEITEVFFMHEDQKWSIRAQTEDAKTQNASIQQLLPPAKK